MLRQLFSIAAKKAAVTAIVGTVVVFTGTYALASIAEGNETTETEEVEEVEEVECTEECPDDTGDEDGADEEETEEEEVAPFELGAVFDESSELEDDTETGDTDGYRNHGEAVSEAARETCPKGPDHGRCVSAVAKSDAGKKNKLADDAEHEDENDEDEDNEDNEDDRDVERSERKAQHEADKRARKADKQADKAARHGAKHDN